MNKRVFLSILVFFFFYAIPTPEFLYAQEVDEDSYEEDPIVEVRISIYFYNEYGERKITKTVPMSEQFFLNICAPKKTQERPLYGCIITYPKNRNLNQALLPEHIDSIYSADGRDQIQNSSYVLVDLATLQSEIQGLIGLSRYSRMRAITLKHPNPYVPDAP
jgi:hypothetical protein